MSAATETVVLGGTGYVAAELLRLIAAHPGLKLAAVVSDSQAGTPIRTVFPHLQDALGETKFVSYADQWRLHGERAALFSAAPHGASAGVISAALERLEADGARVSVVDASADFRFADGAAYSAVYGQEHTAPALLPVFRCALPEHLAETTTPHIGNPGCFATALLLALVPLLNTGWTDGRFFSTGITGSTGSGRTPSATTHHPQRHANLYAYRALNHRHAPEVCAIAEALTGTAPRLHFVPHSGPFARGIHMCVQASLQTTKSADDLRAAIAQSYAGQPFVRVVEGTPRLKDVVGSNYAHIGVEVRDDSAAVLVCIDNLLKGAAGGAMQWMNRLLGFDETTGLTQPGAGWI